MYSHGQGLGSHCVQLEINIDELRTELRNSGLSIAEIPVTYKDEKYILELHNADKSKDNATYFTSFSTEKFLKLPIDWRKVIRKVRIDKTCTDAELISVQQACFSAGINPIIKGYKFIGGILKPANCVNIDFE